MNWPSVQTNQFFCSNNLPNSIIEITPDTSCHNFFSSTRLLLFHHTAPEINIKLLSANQKVVADDIIFFFFFFFFFCYFSEKQKTWHFMNQMKCLAYFV